MMTEAQSFWSAIAGKVKQLIGIETANTFRAERYEVSSAPNGTVIGVKKQFGSQILLPYSKEVANAQVGDPVLVVWWGSMSNARVYYYAKGYDGAAGAGIPAGGTTGQALVKQSNTDYDAAFGTLGIAGGGTGATTVANARWNLGLTATPYFYYGSDVANSNGWYKMCTISQSGYSDCNLNLLLTSGYSTVATGLLYIHTRCDNNTTITLRTMCWMYRYNFNEGDVYFKDNGDNTWSLYVYRAAARYGRIQVQVITETGTVSQTNYAQYFSNNYTKESATPTGGTASVDSIQEVYIGSTQPTDNSSELWIDTASNPTGGAVPAGGGTGAPLVKTNNNDYATSWGTYVVNQDVSFVSGSGTKFTLAAGKWAQYGKVCVVSLNFHITATATNSEVLAVLSGPPQVYTPTPTVLCRAASNNALTAITYGNNGDGNIKIISSGQANVGNYFIGQFVYICQ